MVQSVEGRAVSHKRELEWPRDVTASSNESGGVDYGAVTEEWIVSFEVPLREGAVFAVTVELEDMSSLLGDDTDALATICYKISSKQNVAFANEDRNEYKDQRKPSVNGANVALETSTPGTIPDYDEHCAWRKKWGRWRSWATMRNWKVAKSSQTKRGTDSDNSTTNQARKDTTGVLDGVKVVVFNLAKRGDRKLHMLSLLAALQIPNATFPPTTAATDADIEQSVADGLVTLTAVESLSGQFGTAAMRAYVTHALDWLDQVRVALHEGAEQVLLLEDDLGLAGAPSEIMAQLERHRRNLPPDADALLLEACLESCNLLEFSSAFPGFARASQPFCSGAVLLTRKGMETMLEHCTPIFHGLDHMIARLTFRGELASYFSLPLPLYQDAFFGSDVARVERGTGNHSNASSLQSSPIAPMCWEELRWDEMVLDLLPPIVQQERLPLFLETHARLLFSRDCWINSDADAGPSEEHARNAGNGAGRKRGILGCDMAEELYSDGEMQFVFLERDLSVKWRIPQDGHVVYMAANTELSFSQDLGSWHNESDGLVLVLGPRCACYSADGCVLKLLLTNANGTILDHQDKTVFFERWEWTRGRTPVDEEDTVLADFASTLHQSLHAPARSDVAWSMETHLFDPLPYPTPATVHCSVHPSRVVWETRPADYRTWLRELDDGIVRGQRFSEDNSSCAPLCVSPPCSALRQLEGIPVIVVAVPSNAEDGTAWQRYAALSAGSTDGDGVSQSVGMLAALCFTQVTAWPRRSPAGLDLAGMVRAGVLSEQGHKHLYRHAVMHGLKLKDVEAMGRGAAEVLMAVQHGLEEGHEHFLVAWGQGWQPAGTPDEIRRRIVTAADELPASADMLFLGFKGETCSHLAYASSHPSLVRVAKPLQVLVALFTRRGAQRLLQQAWPVTHRFEVVIAKSIALSLLEAYAVVPPLFSPVAGSVCKEIEP